MRTHAKQNFRSMARNIEMSIEHLSEPDSKEIMRTKSSYWPRTREFGAVL